MVKTTVNLDDEIYAEIIQESIEKYGSTKNLSKIINQRLRNKKVASRAGRKRVTFKAKEELASLDADNEIRKGWEGRNE